MRRATTVWIPGLAVILGLLLSATTAAADGQVYQVGVAAVDITPDYPVRLNGFGFRREESDGVRQHIYAKALAIGSDAEKPAVLITVDGLGIPDSLTQRFAKVLEALTGVPRERLAITASHTHTAPMLVDVAPTIFGVPIPPEHQARIERYSVEFEVKLLEVALEALADRKPATLGWSVGTAKFSKNRRRGGGPVDHSLPMLAVKSPDGKLRAVLVTYACHCVSLSDNKISGDWAGYAQELIERQHPGCVALFSAGCGADNNPIEGVVGDRFEVAEKHGLEIADEVNRLLKGDLSEINGAIDAKLKRIVLPLAPLPTRQEWEARAKAQTPVGHHARTQLARLDRGEPLMTEISYPIETWSFGDSLAMVFLPGEVVCDYSVRLKKEFDAERLWLHAYANACPGYIPSERVLKEGGYEGGSAMTYYDIPGPYAPGLEQKIVDAVQAQIGEKFAPPANGDRTQGSRPRSPQKALAALQPRPGMRVELVAAEPLVSSPVAIDFGPDGRLWVAEMYDYPQGIDGQFGPGGRVKVLTDDDADGRFDRSEVFLDGIPFPTGVTVWRDGVLVSAAPDILFARDSNGDGKADDVRKLYTGFATHNYQARVNSLEYGLDGWVYGSCGLFGGDIESLATSETLNLGSRDFRIHPDNGAIEPASGRTQQGRVRDDWQNWFGCTNSALLLHYPQQDHYLNRNPQFAPPSPVLGIAAGSDAGRVYPIAETVRFKLSGDAGRVTAACGLGIYRDDLLGDEYTGNAFTCEPVGNVVHRRVLTEKGVTYAAHRAADEATSEFLASRDNWFRPVQARTGPDGALWIVDMYRYVIEHPVWIPPDTLAELDVRAGAERGRIYRVLPADAPPRPLTRLDQLDAAGLVAAMDTANGWQRDMAMQMLWWRNDASANDALAQLVTSSPRPVTRLQAMCTLTELEGLSDELLLQALADSSPGVRHHAVRLAERRLGTSPAVAQAALALVDETDEKVQLQLAYSLGALDDARAARTLAQLAVRYQGNAYIKAAVMSSLNASNVAAVLREVQHRQAAQGPTSTSRASELLLADLVGQTAALASEEDVRGVLKQIASPESELTEADRFAQMASLFESLKRARRDRDAILDPAASNAVETLQQKARAILAMSSAKDELLVSAARYVGQVSAGADADVAAVAGLLAPHRSLLVQRSAIEILSQGARDDVPAELLQKWNSYSPQLRGDVLDALLNRENWLSELLTAIEEQRITSADIDVTRRQRITQHKSEAIRRQAAKVFSSTTNADRRRVIAEYTAAMPPAGDAALGRIVFEKQCANCHRLQNMGHEVGPDLAPYANKPGEALVIAVLDPNQAIDPRYHAYSAALVDGRVLSGIITGETATSLSLVAAECKVQEVLRVDMEELRNSGKSLMPEGLEKEISPSALADLVAWFGSLRTPPKQVAGNEPRTVRPRDDGSLLLAASRAEIYGGDITFEEPLQNIGYWHGADDHAVWQVEIPVSSAYDVYFDYACDDAAAGNLFRLDGCQPVLQSKVAGTGGWDRYRQQKIGTVSLPPGAGTLSLRPDQRQLRGALLDLRAVYLVPAGNRPRFDTVAELGNPSQHPSDPASIARYLLDDKRTADERSKLLAQHPGYAAEIIAVMSTGFRPGTPEEYKRIPWLWRVSIAAGRGEDMNEVQQILPIALPQSSQPLEDWRAVVIGGGLINGISQRGLWPREVIESLCEGNPALLSRWKRALALSIPMSHDVKVKSGTRYDALRMVAMLDWNEARPVLERYLAADVDAELQMGAVSGLADVPEPEATTLLLKGTPHYSERNRGLALDGLLRTNSRVSALLDAVASGAINREQLGAERIKRLMEHSDAQLRQRARDVLAP